MEYYLGYCDNIGEQELEEADIVMFAGKFILNEKDEISKQKGRQEVNTKLQKMLQDARKDTHEYRLFLRAQLGEYDHMQDGFQCDVVNNTSCIDMTPLNDAGYDQQSRSIVERGLLFGKVSKIKIFFINTADFKILKYPEDKKDALLKSRTGTDGRINREVFAVIDMEMLPKDADKRAYNEIKRNIYIPGLENNYFMLARVKNIEVYGDLDMKDKLGYEGLADNVSNSKPSQTLPQ
jgi:hypothetical protein